MHRLSWALALFIFTACASLRGGSGEESPRRDLWRQAHDALATSNFARADSLFGQLARDFATTETGRESLFYLGSLRLDPRNPNWDPQRAETALRQYIALDSANAVIHRRPEGHTLFQIARQLNLPAEDRIEALQPQTREVTRRVVVQGTEATALATEVRRLRQLLAERNEQLANRDQQLRRQTEELERIRKTLTGTRPRR